MRKGSGLPTARQPFTSSAGHISEGGAKKEAEAPWWQVSDMLHIEGHSRSFSIACELQELLGKMNCGGRQAFFLTSAIVYCIQNTATEHSDY